MKIALDGRLKHFISIWESFGLMEMHAYTNNHFDCVLVGIVMVVSSSNLDEEAPLKTWK